MKSTFSRMASVALAMWLGLTAGTANAIPTLQLGIAGGSYDWTTDTVIATSSSFSLYAFLLPNAGNLISDTYYLSMAVTPKASTPADLGSFTYNSTTVNVTSDMTYGTPPIDLLSSSSDPVDLPPHSMFPTYFTEVEFSFASSNQSDDFNTQDHPTWGPQPGSGMYYNLFNIDTSNLGAGYAIHFDLYNTKLCTGSKGSCGGTTDTDITKFAPFSHDAQSMTSVVTSIPEPQTYAMLLAGLGLVGFSARRRMNNNA